MAELIGTAANKTSRQSVSVVGCCHWQKLTFFRCHLGFGKNIPTDGAKVPESGVGGVWSMFNYKT